MKRFLPSLIFLLSLPSISLAQKCIIIIGVLDDISRQEIENPHFTLIYEDSIEVPFKYKLQEATYVDSPKTFHGHILVFDYRKGKYTLRVEKEGYEPGSKDFRVVSRRLTAFGLGNLTLKKRRHVELGEATVRATHIKMVMRGDTVVYDAAAFDLAEGSMLDALVEQLPGAELKDGQIRVNGKFIESLLLNGEDFFAGNPQVALENLPAYTVKQIKVYDRAERDAYLKPKGADGKVIGADEHMVMDVQLKKAYATGWMGNVEGGYGLPDDRYLGRAFGLGYRDKARFSAFANLNNIKNTQIGRNGGQWSGGWPQDGELDVKMGGADYYFSRGRAWVAGDVLLTHEEPKVEQKQSAVSFFNSGDVYERQHSVSRERKFHLITTHQLRFTDDNFYFQVIPRLDYLHNDVSRLSRAAQFTANPTEAYRMESLDSLFALGGLRSPFAVSLLNRTGQMQEGPESWLIAGVNASATIKVPDQNDNVKLYAGGEYRRDTERPLTTWSRAFGPQSTAGGTAQNVLQNKNYDARQYHVKAGASYTYWYAPYREHDTHAFIAQPKFDYARDHHDRANTLWQLEESLTDAAAGQGLILPSSVDPARLALDLNNSYHSALAQDDYAPGVELEYQFLPEEGGAPDGLRHYARPDAARAPRAPRLRARGPRHDRDAMVGLAGAHRWAEIPRQAPRDAHPPDPDLRLQPGDAEPVLPARHGRRQRPDERLRQQPGPAPGLHPQRQVGIHPFLAGHAPQPGRQRQLQPHQPRRGPGAPLRPPDGRQHLGARKHRRQLERRRRGAILDALRPRRSLPTADGDNRRFRPLGGLRHRHRRTDAQRRG